MTNRKIRIGMFFIFTLALSWPATSPAEQDPMACVQEIQRVCVHLEEKLEDCLSERGDQLSNTCRDELKTAMKAVQDPSGLASCIPDVQQLCPNLKSDALTHCITEKQSSFSEPCQKYLQSGTQTDQH